MTYRLATVADAEAIAVLHLASWRSAYREFVAPEILEALVHEAQAEVWRRRVVIPEVRIDVEESSEGMLAFCAHGPSGDPDADLRAPRRIWEIKNLHVRPDLRRSGSGGRLFDMAVSHGRTMGAESLTLWVVDGNGSARRFYEKKGMATDGGRTTHTIGTTGTLPVVRYRLAL